MSDVHQGSTDSAPPGKAWRVRSAVLERNRATLPL